MRIFRFQQHNMNGYFDKNDIWCFMSETTYYYRDKHRERRYADFIRKQGGFIQLNYEE